MLPAPERLRRNTEFQRIYRQGATYSEGMVVLHLLRLPDADVRQAGFSVSKKLGGAVVRNRVKRRLRDAYRLVLPQLPRGYQLVFTARRGAAEADYEQLAQAVRRALTRAGLLSDVV